MLPIESFSIENFRSFGPKQQLPLSRINFLFGPNSHGKSSSLMGLGVLVNSLLKNQFHQDKIEHSDNSPIIEMKGDLVNNKSGSKYFELGCSLPYKKEGDSLEINFKVGSLAKG
jgi:AAA15 family ATPase/GTPase